MPYDVETYRAGDKGIVLVSKTTFPTRPAAARALPKAKTLRITRDRSTRVYRVYV